MVYLVIFLLLIVIAGPVIFLIDKYYVKALPEDHSFKVFWKKYVVEEIKEDYDED